MIVHLWDWNRTRVSGVRQRDKDTKTKREREMVADGKVKLMSDEETGFGSTDYTLSVFTHARKN